MSWYLTQSQLPISGVRFRCYLSYAYPAGRGGYTNLLQQEQLLPLLEVKGLLASSLNEGKRFKCRQGCVVRPQVKGVTRKSSNVRCLSQSLSPWRKVMAYGYRKTRTCPGHLTRVDGAKHKQTPGHIWQQMPSLHETHAGANRW